jgi:hypothetical protein
MQSISLKIEEIYVPAKRRKTLDAAIVDEIAESTLCLTRLIKPGCIPRVAMQRGLDYRSYSERLCNVSNRVLTAIAP